MAYSNLKVDKLLGVCAHLVIETERVFANLPGGEDKVSLPLLLAIHDVFPIGTRHFIIDIEGTTGLHL